MPTFEKNHPPTLADDLPIMIAWFGTAMPVGPAFGDPEVITWSEFCGTLWFRRHGPKDDGVGRGFVPARFKFEPDGKRVRRLKPNVTARTLVALDIEHSKTTGELPPTPDELAERVSARGWAAAIWTSHNHRPDSPRCRVVVPPAVELDPDLPVVEIVAEELGVAGVLDRSKIGASSYFYLPSCSGDDDADLHSEIVIPGAAIDVAWLVERAKALQDVREAEAAAAAAEAHAKAAARRAEMLAAGFDPDDSLIEKIRPRLGSLDEILCDHGYDRRGSGTAAKYRHAASQSGAYGADAKFFGGIERCYSHNGGDPLHASNLPSWCTVSAVDAFDVVCILDFGADRKKALHELAERFGLSKNDEKRAVARLIYQLCRGHAPQEIIETRAYAEGERLGLSRDDVIRVATWIASNAGHRRAA